MSKSSNTSPENDKPNIRDVFIKAAYEGDVETVQKLLGEIPKDATNETGYLVYDYALGGALVARHMNIVELFLQKMSGEKKDHQLETILFDGIEKHDLELMQFAINNGLDPQSEFGHEVLTSGLSKWKIDTEAIDLLVKHGADVNYVDSRNGYTPLHSAVRDCNLEAALHLIHKHGARVNNETKCTDFIELFCSGGCYRKMQNGDKNAAGLYNILKSLPEDAWTITSAGDVNEAHE